MVPVFLEAEGIGALGINLPGLVAQLINFGILLLLFSWLFKRFLFPMLDERKKRIEEGLQASEEAKVRLTETETEVAAEMSRARQEAQGIITQAQQASSRIQDEAREASRAPLGAIARWRLSQHFLNDLTVRLAVQAAPDHTLGRGDREVRELSPQVADRRVAFQLDLLARSLDHLLGVGTRGFPRLILDARGRLLRLGNDPLRLLAGLRHLRRHLRLRLSQSRLCLFGGLQPLLDALLALVQHREEEALEDPGEQDQEDAEVDQLRH